MRILSPSALNNPSPFLTSHRAAAANIGAVSALNHFTTTKTMVSQRRHSSTTTSCVVPSIRRRFATTTTTASSTSSSSSSSSSSSLASSKSSSSSTTTEDNRRLWSSQRALRAVELLPSYLADARQVPRYHPVTCPTGALQLGVAESQMLQDLLLPALNNIPLDITSDCIYYQQTQGRITSRTSMANYIQDLLHLGSNHNDNNNDNNNDNQAASLDVEGLVLGAGCNAVLENMCICLAEPGESVLIPTPYYAAFEFDLVARANLHVQPVTTMEYTTTITTDADSETSTSSTTTTTTSSDPAAAAAAAAAATTTSSLSDGGDGGLLLCMDPSVYYPTTAALTAAYQTSLDAGHTPKILLLNHPHNPLGICYPKHVLEECIHWCRAHAVHLISDEIYAGSIYHLEQAGFHSILQVASAAATAAPHKVGLGLGPYVHWVYALSKDFALSGLRVGVAYSENPAIRIPMQKLNDLCQISSQTQVWIDAILNRRVPTALTTSNTNEYDDNNNNNNQNDELWTHAFQRENHKRLRHRCQQLTEVLTECRIPYLPPTAGLFCWIDLSAYLPPPVVDGEDDNGRTNAERERALYLELVNEYGLLLTPGESMRNEEPGFFRIVFTAASDDEFQLGLKRLRYFAETKQQQRQQQRQSSV